MTEGDDDKVTANKDNQTPPLSPGDKGQAAEGSTNLQTNKATELIAEKETATDPKRTQLTATETTDHGNGDGHGPQTHPTVTAKTRGERREASKPFGSLPNDLGDIETSALAHPVPNPISVPSSRHTPAARHGRCLLTKDTDPV